MSGTTALKAEAGAAGFHQIDEQRAELLALGGDGGHVEAFELIDPLRYPFADAIRASSLPKTVK